MYAAFIAVAYESRSWEIENWITAEVRSGGSSAKTGKSLAAGLSRDELGER
jgi:hypothetical protein